MKLNIEVDLSRKNDGISVSITNVDLKNYHRVKKTDIDAAVKAALEVAFIGIGREPEEARHIAEITCSGTWQSQSVCQDSNGQYSRLDNLEK